MSVETISLFRDAYRGRSCVIQRRNFDWVLDFGNGTITVGAPWRIIANGRVAHGSEDDRQRFGLPEPIDGEARANKLLERRRMDVLELDLITADLRLCFDSDTRLDVFNYSSGYEGWKASFGNGDDKVLIIGGGGGRLTIF